MLGLILGGIAAVAGLFGAAKAVEAKSTNDDAKRIISNAKERHESTKNDLDNIQQETSDTLIKLGETKIETWDNHLQYFVSTINRVKPVESKGEVYLDKDLTRIVNQEEFKEISILSLQAAASLKDGEKALGGGSLVAIGAGGIMATVGSSAALTGLGGITAANATIAWLGGGSLLAGGMAGAALLGGLVLAPAFAIFGGLSASKAKENYADALNFESKVDVEIEKMRLAISRLRALRDFANQLSMHIFKLREELNDSVNRVNVEIDRCHKEKIAHIYEISDLLKISNMKKSIHKFQNTFFKKIMKFILSLIGKKKKDLTFDDIISDIEIIDENGMLNENQIKIAIKERLKFDYVDNSSKERLVEYLKNLKIKENIIFHKVVEDLRQAEKISLNYLHRFVFFDLEKLKQNPLVEEVQLIRYSDLDEITRKNIHVSFSLAQLLKKILEEPLLKEDGAINNEHTAYETLKIEG